MVPSICGILVGAAVLGASRLLPRLPDFRDALPIRAWAALAFGGYALACWGVLYGLYTRVIRAFALWDLLPVCLLLEAGAEWFLVPASSRSAGEGPRLRLWTQALAAAGYLLLRLVLL